MNLTPAQKAALSAWYFAREKAEQAKLVIAEEQAARKVAFAALDLTVQEGQARADLPDGWTLKWKTTYERKVDPRAVVHLRAALAEHHVSLDSLIDWKPSLVTKEYRELTAEARAIIDTAITTTPGLPTLALVPPEVKP